MFEGAPKSGGMLRYGIPAYRLPKEILDNEIRYVQDLGVEIKTETVVETTSDVFNQGFKAIFLATGAWQSRKLGIAGEETQGVIQALDLFENFLHIAIGGKRTGKKVLLSN